jgi:adenylate cyclase
MNSAPSLAQMEARLRALLPADLYAAAWVNPTAATLLKAFEHLRALQSILYDYMPRQVSETLPNPGEVGHEWQHGALMFTDLSGFTPLMEANAAAGKSGAQSLLRMLNDYFGTMIEIVNRSGGNLLEFTGDAMLIQFPSAPRNREVAQAVRAGLRMQRAMSKFVDMEMPTGSRLTLGMRIGVHWGRFFTADIGTPLRMEHVLLGTTVQRTKHAEGAGKVGRVNLTEDAYDLVYGDFRFEEGREPGYKLLIDDLDNNLGEFDFTFGGRRLSRAVLMDRSEAGLRAEISGLIDILEPLASYLPRPILNLLVENTAKRQIPPDFTEPTVVFVNLVGLPESVDKVRAEEEDALAASFSEVFALFNAAVEARGGVLKKVTCHLSGSDTMIMFGVPSAHTNDAYRAAECALTMRNVIINLQPPVVDGKEVEVYCQIGLARGSVFAAEIGQPRGRREFNVLGDAVNTAARLMGKAGQNQILITEAVYQEVAAFLSCELVGELPLKGKARAVPIYMLKGRLE